MKKALIFVALATFGFGSFAQTVQPNNGMSTDTTGKKHHKKHKKGDTASKMLDSAKKM